LPKVINFATIFKAKLHFVYIVSDFGAKMVEDYLPKNWVKDQKAKYFMQVENLIKECAIPEKIEVNFYIGSGSIYDEIIRYTN